MTCGTSLLWYVIGLGSFSRTPFWALTFPFTSRENSSVPFKAADLPLPPKSVTGMREGNGLFLVPSEREDIRATTNEILDTRGTIAAVHAKDIS